jgi:hypothetical protein
MTPVALSPLRQQGDVSGILIALPAVLLQDSGAPPTATPSHVQGPSSPPTATLACTQGLGTPLLDTLAHSYAPRCTSGLSPCLYKREVQGHPEGVRAREAADELCVPLSLSRARRACNPYYERHPWCRIIQGLTHILCSIPRQPIWAGTRSDNSLVSPRTPRGRNADTLSLSLSRSLATLVTPTTSTLVQDHTRLIFPLCSISHQPLWAGTHSDKFTSRSRDPPPHRVRNADTNICIF